MPFVRSHSYFFLSIFVFLISHTDYDSFLLPLFSFSSPRIRREVREVRPKLPGGTESFQVVVLFL